LIFTAYAYAVYVRLMLVIAVAVVTACTPSTPTVKPPRPDPTKEASYRDAVEQLTVLNRELETAVRKRRSKQAAEIITKAQPIANLLLAAPRPTLAATQAASDFDDFYGRQLLANRQYGYARFQFQRNLARWKNWRPQTEDTERRRKIAEAGIAECDRLLSK
jgi:hypothetical protein